MNVLASFCGGVVGGALIILWNERRYRSLIVRCARLQARQEITEALIGRYFERREDDE